MKNTRLINLINTLNNKEIKEIKKFLCSPLFNNRPEVSLIFDFITENLKVLKVSPTKERAHQYIAKVSKSKAPYDDQQVRLWMSFLLKRIEKYLVQAAFFKDEVKMKLKLAEIYRERNLPKHSERNFRELQQQQEKLPYRNAAFYSDEFEIQNEQYRSASSSSRMSELNLQKMSDNLDIAYLSQKLRQSCLALSHQTVYKTVYRFGLLDKIINYVEQQDLKEIPTIGIYFFGYQTLSKPEDGLYFQKFKKVIVEHGDRFPAEELGDIYLLAINFCIKRYNEGDHQYLQDEFELYQKGLSKNLFLKNNILSRFTYRNVVTVGIIAKEFEWVEKFIHDYKPLLDKTYRESMFSFSLARLEYSRKNYSTALQLLQKSLYKDLLLSLAAKTVMLKIYYELDEFDTLDSHLDAMRTFIRRKKIIGYHQENYLNLIYFTKKIMETNPFDKAEKKALYQEITTKKAIAEKEWLLENALSL